MTRLLGARGCLAALVTLSLPPLISAGPTPAFDGRHWTVGNHQQSPRQTLTEYVLPGQTVDNWKELVTATAFPLGVPLAALVDRIHKSMGDGCPSLVWNVVKQDASSAVFEWRDGGCGGYPAQNEIDRISADPGGGLHRLAYAIKVGGPLPAAQRKQWLAIVSQVPPAEGSETASAPAHAAPAAAPAPAAKRSAEDLAAGARKSGWPCPKGVSAQSQGGQGGMEMWSLACSNGQHYSVMIDPSGGMTVFQRPN